MKKELYHHIFILPFLLFAGLQLQAQQAAPHIQWSTYWGGKGGVSGISGNPKPLFKVENGVFSFAGTYLREYNTTPNAAMEGFSYPGDHNRMVYTKVDVETGAVLYSTVWGSNQTGITGAELYTAAFDKGEAYLAGQAQQNFPTTPGAIQGDNGQFRPRPVLAKFDTAGQIVFSTYLGFANTPPAFGYPLGRVRDMVVYNGEIYLLCEIANSSDYLVTPDAIHLANLYANNLALTRINAATGALIYSTYLDWPGLPDLNLDDLKLRLLVENGEVHIASRTNSTTFPVTPDAVQSAYGGGLSDMAYAKMDAKGNILYATYLGGNRQDEVVEMIYDNGKIHLFGQSFSINFPVTPDAAQPVRAGGKDMVYTRLDAQGALEYSTHLGGVGNTETPYQMKLIDGKVYLTGTTTFPNFPVTPNAVQPAFGGGQDMTLTILDVASGQFEYSTYLGGPGTDEPLEMELAEGKLYLTAKTSSSSGLPITAGAVQPNYKGGFNDVLLTVLDATSYQLMYGTYLGGNGLDDERSTKGLYVADGKIGLWGITESPDFPVTADAAQINNYGFSDYFLTSFDLCPDSLEINNTVSPLTQEVCQLGLTELLDGSNAIAGSDSLPLLYRNGLPEYQPQQALSSYQWQVAPAASGPWTNIGGATLEDYQAVVGSQDRYFRRLVLPPACCDHLSSDTSNVVEITVNNNIAPMVDGGDPVYTCPGVAVPIGGNPTGTPGTDPNLSYAWDMGNLLNNATLANPLATVQVSTVFTVTVTDGLGCKQIGQSVVLTYKADAGPDKSACGGVGVRIGKPGLQGAEQISFLWSPAAGLSCTTCAQPVATPAVPTLYTLTVTIQLPGGGICVTTDQVLVTPVFEPAPAFAGPDRVLCFDQSAMLGVGNDPNYTYAWSPGEHLNAYNVGQVTFMATGPNVCFVAPNPLTYTLTANRLGCAFQDQATVAVIQARAGIDGCGPRTIGVPDCSPNLNETYTWTHISGPNNLIGPTNIPEPTVGASATASVYQLEVCYNGVCCTDQVVVPPCMCNMVITSSENRCNLNNLGDTIHLHAAATGLFLDPSGFIYTWTPMVGLNTYTGQDVQTTDLVQRTYTVTATHPDDPNFACTANITVRLPHFAPPVFMAHGDTICPGQMVNIGELANPNYSYHWTGPNNYMSSSSNPLVGIGTYHVIVTDNVTGCTSTDVANVVSGAPLANAGLDWRVCLNGLVQLGTPDPSGGQWTYLWSPVANWINGTNSTSPQPQFIAAADLTFTVVVTDPASGCTATDMVMVTVGQTPLLADAPNKTICVGNRVQIGLPPLQLAGVTYSWSPATGLSCTNCAQPFASPNVTTTYTLSVTFPGCIAASTDLVTVTVIDLSFDLGADLTYCPPTGVNIGNNAPLGLPVYLWTPNSFLSSNTIRNPVSTAPGPITYTLQVTNSNGCTATDEITVTPIKPEAGAPASICVGESVQLGASSNSMWPVVWTPSTGLDNPTSPTPIFTAPGPGTYTFTVTQNTGTCTSSDQVTITVNDLNLNDFDNSAVVCTGGCITIGPAPQPGYSYSWFPTTGLSDPNATPTIACISVPTVYTLTVYDPITGCTEAVEVTVDVQNEMAPMVAVDSVTVCLGSNGQFMAVVTPAGMYAYDWVPTTNLSNPYIANPLVYGIDVGTTSYLLTVTNLSTNCAAIAEGVLEVVYGEPVLVVLTAPGTVCENQPIMLSAVITGETSSFSWQTNGDGTFLPSASVLNPTYQPGPTDLLLRNVTLTLEAVGAICGELFVESVNVEIAACQIQDCTIPPSISCPPPVIVECINQVPLPNIGGVTATSNCNGMVTITFVSDVSMGSCPTVITRTYRATDEFGNSADCTQLITVNDHTVPVITCPAALQLVCASDVPSVNLSSVIATDNCGVPTVSHVGDVTIPGSCPNNFQVKRTYKATDGCNNMATCTQTITVNDNVSPVITAPPPLTISCQPNQQSNLPLILGWLDNYTASDNCGSVSVNTDFTPGIINYCTGDDIIVTWTATDACGNTSTKTSTIEVNKDMTPPIFVNCPSTMIMIGNDPDQCSGKINWPIPVAIDECSILTSMVQTGGPLSGSVLPITCPPTPTTITYKATDCANNMATCSFQVMVIDTEKPEFDADILMPGDVTVECDAVPTNCIPRTGGACTPLTLSDVNDNCPGPLTITFTEVSTRGTDPALCSYYTYVLTRTWKVTDCAGNMLIHTQVISVKDTKAPTALCKNATIQLDKTGKVVLNPLSVDNGSFDNCAAFPYLTFSVSPSQFTCANIGTNLVTLSVTDPCGKVGTCQATVTVTEGIAPCTPQYNVETACMGAGAMGNATDLDNGQFRDIITIKSLAMQTWTVTANNTNGGKGAYSFTSPAPPASPVLIPIGTLFTAGTADGIDNDGDGSVDEADEMIYYTLRVVHVDCKGYDITVSNAGGIGMGLSATTTNLQNKACYPTPYFCNLNDDAYCLGTPAFPIEVCELNHAAGSVVPGSIMIDGVPTNVFDAASLGLGAHTVMATFDAGIATQNLVINGVQLGGTMQDAINDPGCKQKITKVINVLETPNVLICNDLVYVSMDADCSVSLGADDVLEGTYYCYGDYVVEVDKTLPYGNGPWVPAVFDASDIGKTYQYRVRHISGGVNLCWGNLKIEDKLAPALDCPINITIACSESIDVSHTGNVAVTDCSAYTTTVDDEYEDFGECASPRAKITRTWIVTDVWGNQSACTQVITITPFNLNAVVFPAEVVVNCEQAYLNPSATAPDQTGRPSINGAPIGSGGYCSASVGFTDVRLEVCAGSYEIYRTWLVANTCLPAGADNPISRIQRIRVKDFGGPQFVCPPTVTVSTDPLSCCATAALPDMIVSEGCSHIGGLEAKVTGVNPNNGNIITFTVGGHLEDFPGNNYWNPDTLAVFDYTQCLPLGTYNVRYKASDECGNTSYCSFSLTVADLVPPVASCDQTTTVAIGNDDLNDCYTPANGCDGAGVTWVKATTFNDGSYDNCHNPKFTIRRMAPYSDCINNLSHTPCYSDDRSEFDLATAELDSIKFYCCEVGTTQTVILRVYQVDLNGNYVLGTDGEPIFNECMIQVEVQDKIKPICQAPANVSVNCENFDPSLWVYGKAEVYDNCCLDTSKVYQGQCGLTHTASYTLFDTVCNKGTITRTFRAFDCHGLSSQCTQRVIVNYLQDYYVKFPNDVIVTVCDGTGLYGEPIFFGEDCELLGVSFTDQIFTVVPDACFKIERTWSIINWCTFNPNQPFMEIPNPNPNPIANASANLAGPTVSACGTLPPWAPTVVKINPTDPLAKNFCDFWDANANGYRYHQIIKIIDGQAPTGTFVTPACDNQNWLTANSNQLWNEPEWWDNGIQTHDLCEEPTDLCITGTDACSGANINIEYLLFLDLDGDGVMETVINSVNTGIAGLGWNTVNYGNAQNPNFSGGTPRSFDERLVPSNQKWGFAIQETVVGNNKTACVRWNTQSAQNTFVAPELPHGTHKIKWLISDGCGNNKEYETTFTVKDCKAPTVVCLNGLSVNIMPTGMIQLWASDFLQYTEDNCTPSSQLKIGIRKCGAGTGFPLNPDGTPQTSVTFTCQELGTQCVELWSIDAAGNADYCETYVIVQDNLGNCPTSDHINVAGALKTEMTDGVEEATVNVNGTSSFTPPYAYFDLSDAGGVYQLMNNVPLDATFTIAPEKDDNPLNGVTTYDLVLISKHILGIEPLNTPYKMIAADANKSGSITTFDIVELRKLILGIYTELPNNTSWRFVDKTFQFPNLNNPFQTAFPEMISVANAMTNQVGEDFAGVKIGDVNNTAVANATMQAEERTAGTALFDIEDRSVKAGETFEVTFKSAEQLKGFQFTMLLDGLKAISTVNTDHVSDQNFNLLPEKAMAISIDGAQAFTVRFRAEKSGKLSSMLGVSGSITRAEAYPASAEGRQNIAFRFDGKTISGVGFELYQNQPNPFVNKTSIGFFLPEATEATLSIFDEAGRMVYQQKGQFAKGENMIALDRALLNTTGVLYYKLETATDSATRKMIQAK